jgi:hypothetical protein
VVFIDADKFTSVDHVTARDRAIGANHTREPAFKIRHSWFPSDHCVPIH